MIPANIPPDCNFRVMTGDRVLKYGKSADLARSAELLPDWYVRAADGVFVPRCDLADYEAGRRVPRLCLPLPGYRG